MITLPFKISGIYGDLAKLEGLARLEESALILEFSIKDALVGVLKTQPKEIRISLCDLAEVTYQQRLFGTAIMIRTRRMNVLAGLPGASGSELRLRCQRRHRELAKDLASQLSTRVITEELKQMADANRPRLPLPPSP